MSEAGERNPENMNDHESESDCREHSMNAPGGFSAASNSIRTWLHPSVRFFGLHSELAGTTDDIFVS
jgi:hypothetical protein